MAMFLDDPLGSFRFLVEIEGMLVFGFREVSGLEMHREVESYAEGGAESVRQFAKMTQYPPLVFKKGMTIVPSLLWDWYGELSAGKWKRKDGTIYLMESHGVIACYWNFYQSYPVKWTGPELNAMDSQVAVESIEIVHDGLKYFGK